VYLDFEIKLVSEDEKGRLYSMFAKCYDGEGNLLLKKQWHNEPLARLMNVFRTWTLRARAQFDNMNDALNENTGGPTQLDLPF